MAAAIIDIEQLRQYREMALWGNWIKDLRTEIFRKMYDKPIHPKNMWMEKEPMNHSQHDEILRDNIRRLQERGTYTPPAKRTERRANFIHSVSNPEDRSYARLKEIREERAKNVKEFPLPGE